MNTLCVSHRIGAIPLLEEITNCLQLHVTLTPKEATRFFKISEGSYSADDAFLGIPVPALRKIAKIYKDIELPILEAMLQSKYNEARLLALLILVQQYKKSDSDCQQKIYQFYLKHLNYVNNWNLVDASAHHILGGYLWDKDKSMLSKLAASDSLWERRIAIVATLYFIRKSQVEWTFKIAEFLQKDSHDLIHKAVGWMLREAGKKEEATLVAFLSQHAPQMPKTMLRYAVERLSAECKAMIYSTSVALK